MTLGHIAGGIGIQPRRHDMTPKKIFAATGALALTATMALAAMETPMVGGAEMYPEKNIVENAVNSADHETLVAALKAAGLVETLQGEGPFTVFAPTNAAFEALPAGTVEGLLEPANKQQLTSVLTYHVVPGAVYAEDVVGLSGATTVQGTEVSITAT